MTNSVGLKIYDMPMSEWARAHIVAKQFLADYPNRIGMRDGCVYSQNVAGSIPLYVYRTKSCVVVRGSKETSHD